MAFIDIFLGVPQSKYAGLAILLAISVVAFAILVGKEPIPMGQKFMFILIMFLVSLPGLLLTLFQLTCLVTGSGLKNQRWWCSAYAWFGSALIILYSVILVGAGVMSLVNGSSIINDLAEMDQSTAVRAEANRMAREMFENSMTVPPIDDDGTMPDTFKNASPNMSVEEKEKKVDPVMAAPLVAPKQRETFEDTPEYDEIISAADPELFSNCGAPVPQ